MAIPTSSEQVRSEFSNIVMDLQEFIAFLENHDSISFKDYLNMKGSLDLLIIQVWDKINYLTIVNKKYSNIFEQVRKILVSLLIDIDKIEKKYIGTFFINWESEYKKGKFRKDLIKFYSKILKQMNKINKKL